MDKVTIPDEGVDGLFLIAPSRCLLTASAYTDLIIQLQTFKAAQIVFLDSLKRPPFPYPLQFFPVNSVADCIEHPASNQVEIQQRSTKNILETITILRRSHQNDDHFKFEKQFLVDK